MKVFATVLLAMLFTPMLHAQTRVLVGANGGGSFGNLFLGPCLAVEAPIFRTELDVNDCFAPLEEHIALGSGWANNVTAGGIVWITKSVGLNGSVDLGQYHTSISKSEPYFFAGVTFRKLLDQWPIRYKLDYFREFNNGIDKTGTETNHVQGGQFDMDWRIGCTKKVCFRTDFNFLIGTVLNQGNPVCDGTFSHVNACPRARATSGTFETTVSLEFPRRKAGKEKDLF